MFSVYDILTFVIILIILIFLLVLSQFEKILAKPRVYLRAALFLFIFTLVIEELIFLEQYYFVVWLYPVLLSVYFAIFPLIYVYSRDLVFNGKDVNRPNIIVFLLFPLLVLIVISIIYYPLEHSAKIKFIELYLTENSQKFLEYKIFQYFLLPAYYLQTAFYVVATLKLISIVRKNINSNPWELLLAKYLFAYVVLVIVFELLVIVSDLFIVENIPALKTVEQTIALVFVSFGLYIGFKQSLVLLQSRISRYSGKLSLGSDDTYVKDPLNENEKMEIKEGIENYFKESKIFLNPNLKLENLSKKIHISTRKISHVVNEIYGTNFNNFINEYRISEAKRLIAQHPHKIKVDEIYTKVGFNSRSAFYRVFKLSTGISPADYMHSIKPQSPANTGKM